MQRDIGTTLAHELYHSRVLPLRQQISSTLRDTIFINLFVNYMKLERKEELEAYMAGVKHGKLFEEIVMIDPDVLEELLAQKITS